VARTFTGNNYLTAGDYDIAAPYITVSAFVRVDSLTQGLIVSKWGAGQEWDLQGPAGAGKMTYATTTSFGGSYSIITGDTVLTLGVWYHVALRQDASTLTGWVNGRQDGVSAVSRSWINSSTPVAIGDTGAGGQTFSGQIANVAIWSAALDPSEILALSEGASPLSIARTISQLQVFLPLDDYQAGGGARNLATSTASFTMSGAVGLAPTPAVAELQPLARDPFLTQIGVPVTIDVGFLDIGVGMFTPVIAPEILPPFVNLGVGVTPPVMLDGPIPPFVPPSLPPTIPSGSPVGPGVPLPPLSSGGLGGIRFYQGPPWRWLVTDLQTNTITFLDRLAAEAVVTYGLNNGSTAKLSVPSANPEVNILHTDGDPFVSEGNRLLYGFRREGDGPIWQCRFAGKILLVEDTGLTENARTIITAWDPWHILYQRPMVNYADTFADKAGFFSFDDTQVGHIALLFLRNTIINQGDLGIDMGDDTPAWSTDGVQPTPSPVQLPGTSYWGSPYKAVWSGRTKSVYQNTNPVDTDCEQGLMVGEIWDQQIETGSVDILLTPIYDPVNRPGYLAEVSVYEKAGRDADDAIFAWDKPSRNLKRINRIIDGTKRANTIRYSWGQGGPPVSGGIPISDGASIIKYGETWHMQAWPGRVEAAALALEQLQLELMKDGQLTVAVEPAPERMPFLFTEWWLGDRIPEYASDRLRASLTGFQRVYGIVLNINENSYEQVPQLLVSPNVGVSP